MKHWSNPLFTPPPHSGSSSSSVRRSTACSTAKRRRTTSSRPSPPSPAWCCRSARPATAGSAPRSPRSRARRRWEERSPPRLLGTRGPIRSGPSASLRSWRRCWPSRRWWTSSRSRWTSRRRSPRPRRSSTSSGPGCSRCSGPAADGRVDTGLGGWNQKPHFFSPIGLNVQQLETQWHF